MRNGLLCLVLLWLVLPAAAATPPHWPAEVHKSSVQLHAKPDFQAPVLTTLKRNTALTIVEQLGLWYGVQLADGKAGFLRVNEVRPLEQKSANDNALHIFMTGKSGHGNVTETAGVRGLDESDLRAAHFNAKQLKKMESNRVSANAAERYAQQHGWQARRIAWADEKPKARHGDSHGVAHVLQETRGLFGRLGSALSGGAKVASAGAGPSTAEQDQEELSLGPMIAGRVLGARPLWQNATAQHRINVIGRWLASQTARPDLPWTFGIIDTPEYNAFAAPGGYILVTRGLYELVDSDQELAAVLGHEITHVVQRDHYEVIRKQQMMSAAKDVISSQINTGGGLAGSLARDYVEKNGAGILLTSLDRSAEYRADEGAEIYLARAGMDPLALYAILQKMMAVGSTSGGLVQLYKTHPAIENRLDRLDKFDLGRLQKRTRRS